MAGERGLDNIRTIQPHEASKQPNEAILQAVADRVAQENKASAGPSRPRPPKFGASTLLGPKGFKLLREMSGQCLQFTDDPVRDLDTLIKLYHDWTQAMYSKFQFRDTIDKIERHCRTAPMKAYLTALWRASEGGGGVEEKEFDELQYVAERNAQDAINVLKDMRAMEETEIVLEAPQEEEDEAELTDPPDFTGPAHLFGFRGI